MRATEFITEARDAVDKEYNSPRYKKDPVDDAERYGPEHDQPYEFNTNQMDARDFLQQALPKLSPRIRKILVLKWFHGLDQREIAERLGLDYVQVRQLESKGLRTLRQWSSENDTGFERDPTAWFESLINEAKLGTEPKRLGRKGSRPERGHKTEPRYRKKEDDAIMKRAAELGYADKSADRDAEVYGTKEEMELDERGKASVKLCTSSKPDSKLGASNLASCKSQGLRARDGNKSHKLGKDKSSRVKVGGKKIKGNKYGGPLPDWS